MEAFGGTKYESLWDWSTWLLLALVSAVLLWPIVIDEDMTWRITLIIIAAVFLAFMVVLFKGTYYRIDGNNLVVYQFFRPTVLPIDRIESVTPTKSWLASPATSLVNRIAIKFSDRKVLRSSMPIIISPVRQKEFIAQLVSINPNIKH